MRRIGSYIVQYWQSALWWALGIGSLVVLLSYKIKSLVPGIAVDELAVLRQSNSFGSILTKDPLYLPYNLAIEISKVFGDVSITTLRGISIAFGLGIIVSFYLLLRHWHSARMALMGTILFASSSWLLHAARFGDPTILYASLPVLVLAGLGFERSDHRQITLTLLLIALGLSIYIPGFIWLVGGIVLWQWPAMVETFKKSPLWYVASQTAMILVLVAPALIASIQSSQTALALIGLPSPLPSPYDIVQQLGNLPTQLVWRGALDPARHLGRVPLLDVASVGLFIMGCYWYFLKRELTRSRLLAYSVLVSLVVFSLGLVPNAMLLPLCYLTISTGATFLLQQWFTVFPRNPIARNIGVTILGLALTTVVGYHSFRYFRAWPATPETRAAYVHVAP